MIAWIGVSALIGSGLAGLAYVLFAIHRRKQDRINLRLIAGRHRLLDEEIEHHLDRLAGFDQDVLRTLRSQSSAALDQLNVLLVDRQAHLLSYQDLSNLQEYKIESLGLAMDSAEAPAHRESKRSPTKERDVAGESGDSGRQLSHPAATPAKRSERPPPPEPRGRDRASLENTVLAKIGQLNRQAADSAANSAAEIAKARRKK